VNAGATVTGTVSFTNNGPSTASGVTYTTTLSTGLAGVTFSTLPTGVTAAYNSATGVVTYTGLPTTLASGVTEGPITIAYTQPATATSSVTSTIAASTADPNAANNTATVTVAGALEADLATALSFPASVNAGATVTGTVSFTNNGPSTASGVTYTTTLSTGLAGVTFSTLPTGVTAAYNSATGVVTYTGLPTTLASGATEGPITISYTQPATATSTVASTIAAATADPNATNNSASATIGGLQEADLATSLAFPTTVNAGGTVTGTVGFTNNGPSTATTVTYTTTLSTGLAGVTFSTLPTGVTAAYNSATGVVTYTGLPSTLASGATEGPITIAYTQPAAASSTVTATIGASTADPNAANNSASATIAGATEADLATTLAFPATVNAGATVTGTVSFTNNGPSTATGVSYATTLTTGLAGVSFSTLPTGVTAAYNSATGAVTFTGLPVTLTSGSSEGPITISYTQPATGTSSVSSTIAATTADPNAANNTASVTVAGALEADLATTLAFPATVNAGATVTGTVSFKNNGPSTASGVTYTTTLSTGLAGVTFSTLPTGVTAAYNSATGVVTYTGLPSTLASGVTEGPITIAYTQPASATSTVTATIGATTADPNSANNSATATIGGAAEADLATSVAFASPVNAGQTVTGTVSFANNGPSTATGVTYTTNLTTGLAGVTFSGLPTGVTAAYNSATGVVTYTGLPTSLASGATEGPITISYTQPGTAVSTVSASISAATADPNAANNTASVTVAGAGQADLATTLAFPATVNAGQTVTGTVGFNNNGPSSATGVTYTTTLTPGLVGVTFSTLPVGVAASYNSSTGAVSFTGLPVTLAAGVTEGPITIAYTQPATASSTVSSTIAAATADPNAANNTATATIGGALEADLATTLAFPATVNAGATVTGTVSFANNGPSTASGIAYTTTLATGLAAVTFSGLPTGVTAAYNSATGAVTFTGLPVTLAAGVTEGPITIAYTQPATASSTVSSTIAAATADPNPGNNSASVNVGGVAEADLAVSLAFPATVNAGSTVSGTATFVNNGPSAATGVTYTTTLATGLLGVTFSTLPTGVTAAYNSATGAVTFTGLPTTLASGVTEGPITIAYTQPAAGTSSVAATIAAATADPNAANNSATGTIAGALEADLAATLAFPASVNAGQIATGTVSFANNGPSAATGVTYTTTLTTGLAGVTFSTLPTGVTATYNSASGAVTFTGLPTTLASGATEGPITIAYTQPASATSTVAATIAATTADPNPANNTATVTIGGVSEADLATTLAFPVAVNAGQTVTGSVSFANNGPSTATGITYTTTLATGLANVTFPTLPTGVTAAYNGATGVVTYTGLPVLLGAGALAGPITISYTQPASANSTINATIAAATADPNLANNTATTTVGGQPVADTAVTLAFPTIATALTTITGTVTFSNAGPSIASGVIYGLTLTPGLGTVTFGGLPVGATATYNNATGGVTFTGLPASLGVPQVVGPISISYTQPANNSSSVLATISSSVLDPNLLNNTAQVSVPTAPANADLSIQMVAPPDVAPDGALVYTLTIANNGPGAANGATFADTLPASLGAATASCQPLTSGVLCGAVVVAGHAITGTIATLPSGASAIITITTTGPASGSVTNVATVAPPAGVTDPNLANNTSTATTIVGLVPQVVDLAVVQSGTTSVQVLGAVTYIVDVTNAGPAAANNALFTYTAAPVVSNVAWTCQAVAGGALCPQAQGTGSPINQTIATFPLGGHLVYTITGIAPAAPQQYVNTATIAAPAGFTDSNPSNNTAVATTNVQAGATPEADVAVTLTGPSTVAPNGVVTYSVVVTNNGPAAANGTTLSAPVPGVVTGVTTTCAASGGAVCPVVAAGNAVAPVIPTLPVGGLVVFTITGTAPASGSFSESASVTPAVGTLDPVPGNNVAGPVVTTIPTLSADLSIQKNGPAQVLANGIVNYTLIVYNAGPNAANGALVTDVLPPGLTQAQAVCAAATGGAACGTQAITNNTLSAVIASLPAASSVTFSVSAHAPASGSLSNSASVAAPTGVSDPNPVNNSAGPVQTSIVSSLPNQADLSVSVTGPSTVAPGAVLTYVVTVANAGPTVANAPLFSNSLPNGLANLQAVCGAAIGGAVCGPVSVNGSAIASTITTLPAGASLQFTITMTAPASGSVTDSASIGAAPGVPDPNLANNTARASTSIGASTGVANLGIAKTGPDTAGTGTSFSYSIVVSNAGPAAADGALVADAIPAGLTNIQGSCTNPTNGAVCGPVQVAGSQVSSLITHLPALGTVTLTITVTAPITSGLQPLTLVNRASVTPPAGISDPDTSDNVSGAVETAIVSAGVSGTVWLDLNHDHRLDPGDPLLPGWIVELLRNGAVIATTVTNSSGQYSFGGVAPGPGYAIDFRDPGTKALYGTPVNGEQGVPNPNSDAVIGNGIIESLTLKPGLNIVQQSLPVDPTGVVYDSVARTPVGGATVTLVGPAGFNPATELVGGAANVTQVVPSGGAAAGIYQFLLINPGLPGGAPAGLYTLQVTPPAGYLPPPAKGGGVAAPGNSYPVPGPSGASTAIQPHITPPPASEKGAATAYYLSFLFASGSGSVVNNNIPLDRIGSGALTVQKSGNTASADIGETVLYTVDVTTTLAQVQNVTLTDQLPRGFVLIPGTTTINGAKAADPKVSSGSALTFTLGTVTEGVTTEVKYRVRVGAGAQEGDGVNRAQASNGQGASSNVATYKVDVNGGVFTTNACVVGKVYVDCNGNRIQDEHEPGIPGVRLYFSDGTFVVTDSEGKYSYCGLRPTTHTLKVDRTTLPPGSRLVESSNRNALDPNSLFIDLKNGELHQADFIEGSCTREVLDAVKARHSLGEVNGPKSEKPAPALIFDSTPNAPAAPSSGAKP
jgi:uncharacterized repeat protein (TIGR01451 family)